MLSHFYFYLSNLLINVKSTIIFFLIKKRLVLIKNFTGGSDGKASAYNVGDLGSIPELGRSPGEGNGYSLQYSWVSVIAQLVKNPPAMQETWVRSLGQEDLLEKG